MISGRALPALHEALRLKAVVMGWAMAAVTLVSVALVSVALVSVALVVVALVSVTLVVVALALYFTFDHGLLTILRMSQKRSAQDEQGEREISKEISKEAWAVVRTG
jgi:predicted tellurium resistance membrane protein TerC